MGQPYIGQLKLVGFNFAPVGWSMCAGQLMAIAENDALFTLLGTTFGGDGQETFGLPQLGGRIPIHAGTDKQGNTYTMGEMAGVESVTITSQQTPIHNHGFIATANNGTINNPGAAVVAAGQRIYTQAAPNKQMSTNSLTLVGGNQPHENMQPYQTLTWIISLYGIFPSQG